MAGSLKLGGLLHDGRARNVAEAVEWHAGEASAARARFRALSRFGQGRACGLRKRAIKGSHGHLPQLASCAGRGGRARESESQGRARETQSQGRAGRRALAVADQFVIPTYRALVQATEAQEAAWTAFAAKRETGDFASLRTAYNAAADAWANAQLIKTGPITLFLRYDRFAYWPEARNATQRALDQLLASKNPERPRAGIACP